MNRAERRRLIAAFTKNRTKLALKQAGPLPKLAKQQLKAHVRAYVTAWAKEDLKLTPDKTRDNITACLQNDTSQPKKSTP